ncbi:retrovirus-related pol polyprotein from transposon TNT 1-94 [Tanacetum coccineum]
MGEGRIASLSRGHVSVGIVVVMVLDGYGRGKFGELAILTPHLLAESTGIRVEAPKMLWADSVSTAYLFYRIPYVPIGLRIPEEEWRGKDTSLTHLKVFGCDSFVKVKDVCGKAIKCTFIGSGSNEMRYSFRDTKSHQKSQVELVDILENLVENDNIVAEHGLSSKITQSQMGALIRVRGPKIVEASRIVEDQMKNTLKMEHPARREALRLHRYKGPPESLGLRYEMLSLEKNQTYSLVRISAGKKASQRLWMFKVKEEHNGRKRYKARLVVKGFQLKRGVDLSHPVDGGHTG